VAAAAAPFRQRRCCAISPTPLCCHFTRRDWAVPSRILRSSLVGLRGRGIRVPCLFFMALFRVVVAAEVPWVCEECVGVLFRLLVN